MRNKIFIRTLALTILLSVLTNVFYPSVSLALTSGPNAPEFTSFEPIDVTDMVNLATGDFTYSLPLFEIPGPEGNFPVSMAYHAGIMPEEEASWVGLGWSLNMGAINRTVNSYADDILGGVQTRTDDWSGGESSAVTVGVGFGYGCVGVNYSMTFAQDTYQGFGVGESLGVGVGLFGGVVGVNASVGVGPYGKGGYVAAGVSVGTPGNGVGVAASVGVVHSFDDGSTSVYGSVGITYGHQNGPKGAGAQSSILDISLDSKGLSPSVSAAGLTASSTNSNADHLTISTSSFGLTMPIPLPYGFFASISFGISNTRYFLHQNDYENVYGSLYAYHTRIPYPSTANPDNLTGMTSFDSYAMIDPLDGTNLIDADPDKVFGGSLPSYDYYSVLAQGLNGSIQPYLFDNGNLYRFSTTGAVSTDNGTQKYFDVLFEEDGSVNNGFVAKPAFRFVNDFSNSLTRNVEGRILTNGALNGNDLYGSILDDNSSIGKSQKSLNQHATAFQNKSPEADFNYGNRQLAGSKHIDWYTNYEIDNGTAHDQGFIAYDDRFNPRKSFYQLSTGSSYDVRNQIGGFKITNERGLTYHYSLPVYAYEDYSRSHNSDHGDYTIETYHIQPYAYTWLLTGITGPDYVDRGNAGLDPADWGYYVRFDYGKWTDQYTWRNPVSGANKDIDGNTDQFSCGKKELYYLDAMHTRTHTALFVKDIRDDSKGVSSAINGGFNFFGKSTLIKDVVDPSFTSVFGTISATDGVSKVTDKTFLQGIPVSTLRLSRILLFNTMTLNRKLNYAAEDGYGFATEINLYKLRSCGPALKCSTSTNSYQGATSAINYIQDRVTTQTQGVVQNQVTGISDFHNADNVIDESDLVNFTDAKNNLLTLADLESVAIKEIDFSHDYSLCNNTVNSFHIDYSTFASSSLTDLNNEVAVKTGKLTLNQIQFKGINGTLSVPVTQFQYGLNPNYGTDQYDMWGSYKSDYDGTDKKNTRETTVASSASVAAWSLSKVITGLGAEINIQYESDSYSKSVLTPYINYPLKALVGTDVNQIATCSTGFFSSPLTSVELQLYSNESDFSRILSTGDTAYITGVYNTYETSSGKGGNSDCNALVVNTSSILPRTQLIVGTDISATTDKKRVSITNTSVLNAIRTYYAIPVTNTKIYYNNQIVAINLLVKPKQRYGGGIRTKSVEVANTVDNYSKKTLYAYTVTANNMDISSGVTSYEPVDMGILELSSSNTTNRDAVLKSYRNSFMNGTNMKTGEIMANKSYMSPAGVIYSKVTVRDIGTGENETSASSRSEYYFSTFDEVYSALSSSIRRKVVSGNNAYITLRNFSNMTGILKGMASYARDGVTKLYEKQNYFLHQDASSGTINVNAVKDFNTYTTALATFANQGRVDQLYHEKRSIYTIGDQLMLTEIEEYPIIPIGQQTMDWKINIGSSSTSLGYDFYTGDANLVRSQDEFGNTYISQTVAAYEQYPSMGLKVNNSSNAHMLTQTYGNYMYKVPNSYNYTAGDVIASKSGVGIVNASVQIWGNDGTVRAYDNNSATYSNIAQSHVWRKRSGYIYTGSSSKNTDGTVQGSSFVDYVSGSSQWKLAGEITLYDTYSHVLENRDINNNYSATLMSPVSDITHDAQYTIATCSNAKFGEFTYCGAEYYFDYDEDGNLINEEGNPYRSIFEGNVDIGDGLIVPGTRGVYLHTGKQALYVPQSKNGFTFTLKNSDMQKDASGNLLNKYSASVWAYLPGTSEGDGSQAILNTGAILNAKVSSTATAMQAFPVAKRKAGSWYLITLNNIVPVAGQDINVWVSTNGARGAYFDDFKVQPMGSNMTAYVYDRDFGRLTDILDNDNFYTRYTYDNAGRVTLTAKEIIYPVDKILQKKVYGYKGLIVGTN